MARGLPPCFREKKNRLARRRFEKCRYRSAGGCQPQTRNIRQTSFFPELRFNVRLMFLRRLSEAGKNGKLLLIRYTHHWILRY